MNILSQLNSQPATLTEEQQVILREIQWQLSLCTLALPEKDSAKAEINRSGEEGIALKMLTGNGYASLFLPFCLYKDGFMHPSGEINRRSGGRSEMPDALRLAAAVLEQLDALSEETLSNGPRSQWIQRQIELNDWE
jgi:hypothetical protein